MREVAKRFSVTERTISNWIAHKGLPVIRLGDASNSPVRIPADGLDHWLNERDDYKRLVRHAYLARLLPMAAKAVRNGERPRGVIPRKRPVRIPNPRPGDSRMTYDDYELEEVTDEDIRAAAAQLIEYEMAQRDGEEWARAANGRAAITADLPDLAEGST